MDSVEIDRVDSKYPLKIKMYVKILKISQQHGNIERNFFKI